MAQPLQAARRAAGMFDATLEGAAREAARMPMPGRLGHWLATLKVSQLGNDEQVAAVELLLTEIRVAVHEFALTLHRLPEHERRGLDGAGLGPSAFETLVGDPRLETTPRPPTRAAIVAVIREARARASKAVRWLDEQGGYR